MAEIEVKLIQSWILKSLIIVNKKMELKDLDKKTKKIIRKDELINR